MDRAFVAIKILYFHWFRNERSAQLDPLPVGGFDKVFDEMLSIFRGLLGDGFIQFIITVLKVVAPAYVSLFNQAFVDTSLGMIVKWTKKAFL